MSQQASRFVPVKLSTAQQRRNDAVRAWEHEHADMIRENAELFAAGDYAGALAGMARLAEHEKVKPSYFRDEV